MVDIAWLRRYQIYRCEFIWILIHSLQTTILGISCSIVLIVTVISLLLGGDWALDFDRYNSTPPLYRSSAFHLLFLFCSSPGKFVLFQMVFFRVEEWGFCLLVMGLAGDWDLRKWCVKETSIADYTGETHSLTDDRSAEETYGGSYGSTVYTVNYAWPVNCLYLTKQM